MTQLIDIQNKNFEYDYLNKTEFHKLAKAELRKLVKHLGMTRGTYDIRSNLGGDAVAGEVILHTEKVYLQIISKGFGEKGLRVMYRTCKGRKDYTGGQNNYVSLEEFLTPEFRYKLSNMIFSDLTVK